MPGFDQSGPNGEGAMTGRGMGRCGSNASTDTVFGFGRGAGRGRGRGAGMRGGFGGRGMRFANQPGGSDANLTAQVDELKKTIAALEQRLARISKTEE